MEVEQPAEVALLDAVRTELTKLTLDCVSDSCPSLSPTQHEGSLPDSNFSPSSFSTSIVMVETPITSPDNELEPFPEYQDAPDNSADERLWEELFTLAMKEDIRSEQIDPRLTLTFVPTEAQCNRLDDIKDLLSNPKLPKESRANLVAITKKVIRLEYLLFRNSDEFLNAEDTAEAQKVASYILDWIAAVDNEVQESLNTTSPVVEVLETLQHEDMAAVHRFRQMASVVFSNLSKPRSSEQKFLLQLLDLYDEWIYRKFIDLTMEFNPKSAHVDLARYLQCTLEYFTRCCTNYEIYRSTVCAIEDHYFTPHGMKMETYDA